MEGQHHLSLLDEVTLFPSEAWIAKPKAVIEVKLIDEKDYPERAVKLFPLCRSCGTV